MTSDGQAGTYFKYFERQPADSYPNMMNFLS
jgi:hypothetical protein